MASPSAPVVGIATVNQTEVEAGSLWRLLDSCDPRLIQVIMVCRGVDEQLRAQVEDHPAVLDVVAIGRAGLSRARNAGLQYLIDHAAAEDLVVCFPDDDCYFEPDNIPAALRLLAHQDLVLGTYGDVGYVGTGRPGRLTMREVFHEGNSIGIFTRWAVVKEVDGFDERLGVGSGDVEAAEDIEFLARAVSMRTSARYDPSIVVRHPRRTEAVPERSGAYLAVAVRYVCHGQSVVRIVRAVVGSLIGRSPIRRSKLVHLLRPRRRAGLTRSAVNSAKERRRGRA